MGIKLSDIKDKSLRDRIGAADNNGLTNYESFGIIGETYCTMTVASTTDCAKLNKTEAAFLSFLQSSRPSWIGTMAITLKIGDDCRYTPDFSVVTQEGRFIFYEVKGFWRDDARVKIRVAARNFRWARFMAVQKDRSGWKFEEIKP